MRVDLAEGRRFGALSAERVSRESTLAHGAVHSLAAWASAEGV